MLKNLSLGLGAGTISVAVALVALLIVTGTVFAAGDITVGSTTVDNTDDAGTVTVSAAAPSGSGIGNWTFEITYNPADLGTPTCQVLKGGCEVDPAGATGIIRVAGAEGDVAGLTGTVDLVNITANAGIAAGECSPLTISTVTAFEDQDGDPIADPTLGAGEICVAAATPPGGETVVWGDVDCKGDAPNEVATRDSQAILRHVLEQNPLSQEDGCPEIGSTVQIG